MLISISLSEVDFFDCKEMLRIEWIIHFVLQLLEPIQSALVGAELPLPPDVLFGSAEAGGVQGMQGGRILPD